MNNIMTPGKFGRVDHAGPVRPSLRVGPALSRHALIRYIERYVDGQVVAQLRAAGLAEHEILRRLEALFHTEIGLLRSSFAEAIQRLRIRPGYDRFPLHFVISVRGVRIAVRSEVAATSLTPRLGTKRPQRGSRREDLRFREERHAARDSRVVSAWAEEWEG